MTIDAPVTVDPRVEIVQSFGVYLVQEYNESDELVKKTVFETKDEALKAAQALNIMIVDETKAPVIDLNLIQLWKKIIYSFFNFFFF